MWALHHATQTSAVVWVRSIINGLITVECDGQVFEGDTVATAVDDGCGVCTVMGLAAGRVYPFTARVGGAQVAAGSLRTMPADGATFSVGVGSCAFHVRDPIPLAAAIEQLPDLAGMYLIGDQIYTDEPKPNPATVNGEYLVALERADPLSESTTIDQLYRHYRAMWQHASTMRMHRTVPHWFIADDHDYGPGNGWDWTLAAANASYTWASDLSQLQAMAQWCAAVFRAYSKGNPDNTARYWSHRINAQVEVFAVDAIKYRDPADGSGTTILGATQKAWLKAALATSTAAFKVIVANKLFYGGADDFSKYNAERLEMEAFFSDMSGWLMPGGCVWIGGDIHYPTANGGPGAPIWSVCASALSSGNATPADGYANRQRWKCSGYFSSAATQREVPHSVSYVRVHGAKRMEVGTLDAYGGLIWRGYVLPGSNVMQYR